MYKYKLNNSYTVYVNWAYYSECAKICKSKHKSVHSTISKKPASVAVPLPCGTKVRSKAFGIGTVLSTSNGTVSVLFAEKEARFVYPDAFKQGFLAAV